jgi:hypothetical protein
MRSLAVFFFILCFGFFPLQAQEKSGPKEKTFKQELKSNRQVRKEAREKRKLERAERKAIKKHHKRIQTKAVRKRMKQSRKLAVRNHDHKREFFVVRWFKKLRKK